MPKITDPSRIRAILETDRRWAVYAMGDLDPGYFENSSWYSSADSRPAVVLLYCAFPVPVLFTVGNAQDLQAILDEDEGELTVALSKFPEIYAVVRPDVLPLLEQRYQLRDTKQMCRMVLRPTDYKPVSTKQAVRLGSGDLEAVRCLYDDGKPTGEEPEFYLPTMLEQGSYFGVFEGGQLIAVGGTQILSPNEGVAGIGNIYVRRDRRGRGLGAEITSAVTNQSAEDQHTDYCIERPKQQ